MPKATGLKIRPVFIALLCCSLGILILTILMGFLPTNTVLRARQNEIVDMLEANARVLYLQMGDSGTSEADEWAQALNDLPMNADLKQYLLVIDSQGQALTGNGYIRSSEYVQDTISSLNLMEASFGITKNGSDTYYYCFSPIASDDLFLGLICPQNALLKDYNHLLSQIVSVVLVLFAVSFLVCLLFAVRPMRNLMAENANLEAISREKNLLLVDSYLRDLLSGNSEFLDLPQFLLEKDLPINFERPFYLAVILPGRQDKASLEYNDITAEFGLLADDFFRYSFVLLQRERVITCLLQSDQGRNQLVDTLANIHKRLNAEKDTPFAMFVYDECVYIEDIRAAYIHLQRLVPMRMFWGLNCYFATAKDIPESHRSITESERISLQEQISQISGKMLRENENIYNDILSILWEWNGYWPAYEEVLLIIKSELEQMSLRLGVENDSLPEPIDFNDCLETETVEIRLRNILSHLSRESADMPRRRQMEYSHQIAEMIRSHALECDFSLQQIADSVGLSTAYLSRLYKQTSGKAVVEEISQLRMREAVRLLGESTMPVGEIYKYVGYTTNNYFYRVFRKTFGITPKAYRDMSKDARSQLQKRNGEEEDEND